jgi:hypothetical protein
VLVDFVGGGLREGGLAALEGHLERCDECCALVAELCAGSPPGELSATVPAPPSVTESAAPELVVPGLDVGPRFEVLARLGAGGMGVVVAARDRARGGAVVALKALPTGAGQGAAQAAELLLRFKREFRALSSLSHENLVRLGDLVEHAGQWMFTMELVQGRDFLAYTRPEGALDLARLCAALAGLARGVEALHAAGFVHRDLKPSNVLVTGEGAVKILDFGLVTDDDAERDLTGTGAVVGTIAYMAPEQAAGARSGAAADWWAVGAMLYEALTGARPHRGRPVEVLQKKQTEDPPPPRRIAPGTIPAPLDDLAVRLLARRPEDRADGRAVTAALGGLAADPGPRAGDDASFVGRTEELSRLFEALDASRRSALAVLVTGESGIGKSTLVEAFLSRLRRDHGALVIAGRCHEREEIPFRAVDAAIDALSRHLDTQGSGVVRALSRSGAALLVRTFPVLGRVRALAEVPAPPTNEDRAEEVRQAFAALRELLGALAEDAPLVIAVDDLQWADDDSLALLREALRPPEAPRLLLVGTVRAGSGLALPALRAALGVDPLRVELGPLPRAAGEELARRLGASTRARDVAQAAGGHPLFLRELSLGGAEARGASLEEALSRRVSREPRPRRALLEVLCLAEAPLEAALLARAAEIPAADLAPHADALVAARLVRRAPGDLLEPYHAKLREAVRAQLAEDAALAGHRRLLSALREAGAPLSALLPHLTAAGERAAALAATTALAERAERALAFGEAVHLRGLVLTLVPEEERDARRAAFAQLAAAQGWAGRGVAAASSWLAAARLAGDDWEAAEMRRRALDELVRAGRAAEALALLDGALAPTGVRVPRGAVGTVLTLLLYRAWLALRGTSFTPREEAACDREALLRIDLCFSVSAALFAVDVARRGLLASRHLSLALALGEPRRVARALAGEAMLVSTSASARARRRGARILDRVGELSRTLDDPQIDGMVEMARALRAQVEGRWADAVASFERAHALISRKPGHDWERAGARTLRTFCLSWQGKVAELAPHFDALLRDAEHRDDAYMAAYLAVGAGVVVWLAADDPARLRQAVLRGAETQPAGHFSLFGAQQALALIEADLYDGEPRRALARLGAAPPPMAARIAFFRVRWHDLLGRASLMLAHADDDRRALAAAARAARALERMDMPWPAAHAALLRAGIAALSGDRPGALGLLGEARSRLEARGMLLWAAAARLREAAWGGAEAGEAEAWMRAQGVVAPAKIARQLVPG